MLGKYYKGFIIKKNKNGYDVYLIILLSDIVKH